MTNFYEVMESLNLNNKPVWTISDKNKVPMNARAAVLAHFNRDEFFKIIRNHPYWHTHASRPEDLVTLTELRSEPAAPLSALTLSLDLSDQSIMVIDIEQYFDNRSLRYLQRLPVIYSERSRHGGQHYIVKVPKEIQTADKYQALFSKSRVKFAQTAHSHSGIELFFRKHFITFTQNIISINQSNTTHDLRFFLDYVLKQANTNTVTRHNYLAADSSPQEGHSHDATVILNHGLTKYNRQAIKGIIAQNDDPDDSTREYQDIFTIARFLIKNQRSHYKQLPIAEGELQNPKSINDTAILAWVLLQYTYEFLDSRQKLDRPASRNQSYIEYTINKALSYALENIKD